jgi:hypothetical protein
MPRDNSYSNEEGQADKTRLAGGTESVPLPGAITAAGSGTSPTTGEHTMNETMTDPMNLHLYPTGLYAIPRKATADDIVRGMQAIRAMPSRYEEQIGLWETESGGLAAASFEDEAIDRWRLIWVCGHAPGELPELYHDLTPKAYLWARTEAFQLQYFVSEHEPTTVYRCPECQTPGFIGSFDGEELFDFYGAPVDRREQPHSSYRCGLCGFTSRVKSDFQALLPAESRLSTDHE